MTTRLSQVLILCTGNSARSILSEGILRQDGKGKVIAHSAGSVPKGAVNPYALKTLQRFGYAIDGLRSKSWDEFTGAEAAKLDFVITVCDDAAGETCPVWMGRPLTAHWGLEDPNHVISSEAEIEAAFEETFHLIKARMDAFLSLDLDSPDRESLKKAFKAIGGLNGATPMAQAQS